MGPLAVEARAWRETRCGSHFRDPGEGTQASGMSARELVGTVLVSVVSSGVGVWLFREWISTLLKESIGHKYEAKRIQFEADLKREFDAGLERLRSELSIEAARRTVEHTRIHERRLEIISELGGKLFNLRRAFVEYTAPMRGGDQPDLKTSRQSLGKVIEEFDAALQPRRCFIPSATLERLEAFGEEVRDIAVQFQSNVESFEQKTADPEQKQQKWKTWGAARTFVVDRSKALLTDLHQDFQRILGIADPSTAAASSPDDGSTLCGG